MLTSQELFDLARSRYSEAKILLQNNKPDGAVYLCGYALELVLKLRIVKLLDWDGYPNTNTEFEKFKSFRVHDLETLLDLSGLSKKIRQETDIFADWQIANKWNSEIRYKTEKIEELEAKNILESTKKVLNYITKL